MPRPDSSVVERGPEKAGVGGSIPSLATTPSIESCNDECFADLRFGERNHLYRKRSGAEPANDLGLVSCDDVFPGRAGILRRSLAQERAKLRSG